MNLEFYMEKQEKPEKVFCLRLTSEEYTILSIRSNENSCSMNDYLRKILKNEQNNIKKHINSDDLWGDSYAFEERKLC